MSDQDWMKDGGDQSDFDREQQPWVKSYRQRLPGEGAEANDAELREALAALAHDQWSGWMAYLFARCQTVEHAENGYRIAAYIPPPLVGRWRRQMETPYADLPEEEKASDRAEADRVLALLLRGQEGDEWRFLAELINLRAAARRVVECWPLIYPDMGPAISALREAIDATQPPQADDGA